MTRAIDDSGLYMLLLRVRRAEKIVIHRHAYRLPAGWYVYVGSAQRGLRARIARHLRAHKRMHWHIDYLRKIAEIEAVRTLAGAPQEEEARLARAWCEAAELMPIPKFGASDSAAPSHLVGFRRRAAVLRQPMWQRAAAYLIDPSDRSAYKMPK